MQPSQEWIRLPRAFDDPNHKLISAHYQYYSYPGLQYPGAAPGTLEIEPCNGLVAGGG